LSFAFLSSLPLAWRPRSAATYSGLYLLHYSRVCQRERLPGNAFVPIAGRRRFSSEARRLLSHVIMLEQATWIAFRDD